MEDGDVTLVAAIASAVISGLLAFASAMAVLFVDRVLSARRKKRDSIIEHYDAERETLFVIKKWLTTACALLDRNVSAAKNLAKIPTFSEKDGELVTTLSVNFLSEVKIIDLSVAEVRNQTLQVAFLNIEQSLADSNAAARDLSKYYERIVGLCYSNAQWLLKSEALRNNTNRDLKRIAGEFVNDGMVLIDKILETICMIELYTSKLRRIAPKQDGSVKEWGEFVAKKKQIVLSEAEIQEKATKFKEEVKKKPK